MLTSFILTAIASGYGLSAAACEAPSPVTMPDGATSTREQMLAAQAQVRAYQASMNEFVACLDSEVDAQGETQFLCAPHGPHALDVGAELSLDRDARGAARSPPEGRI